MSNNEYFALSRTEVAGYLPDSYATVLEIGCGEGGFRKSLKQATEVWGVEPNPIAAEVARAHGYRALTGTYQAVCDLCPDGYFDLIVCNDVIEHMVDHERFLSDIKAKIKPGGTIAGSVPNVRYFGNLMKLLLLRDWTYQEEGILDRTHLRFFTEKSLRKAVLANGYSIERMGGINSEFSKPLTARQLARNLLLVVAIVLTLGHARDTQYLQHGFRIRVAA